MKIIAISFGCLTIALLANSAFTLRTTNVKLTRELQIAGSYQQQAQELASLNSQQKLVFEASIVELEESLLEMKSQLSKLTSALEIAEKQMDPAYQKLLESAGTEATAEINSGTKNIKNMQISSDSLPN